MSKAEAVKRIEGAVAKAEEGDQFAVACFSVEGGEVVVRVVTERWPVAEHERCLAMLKEQLDVLAGKRPARLSGPPGVRQRRVPIAGLPRSS